MHERVNSLSYSVYSYLIKSEIKKNRGVFRTLTNIYEGAFLEKKITAVSKKLRRGLTNGFKIRL